ncbi:MAG: hypothetical protein IJQ43_01530 [Oscillospiraceae bacterium]|nr:hypothetical protein [Oscillospiraceae bacterium]
MKKYLITSIVLMCVLLMLSACGKASETPPASDPTPPPVSEPTPEAPPAPAESAAPSAEPEPTPEASALDEEKYNAALALIDEDVALLYDAIGQPLEAYYAPSCLNEEGGTAEDGELIYPGFWVWTYRDGGEEIVKEVNLDVG